MSKRPMRQSDFTVPIPQQGPKLKQSQFTAPIQAPPPRREMDMSTPKTAREIDEMTSAEYAKYIRYNAPKETAPADVAPVVLEDDPSMASVAGVTPTEVSVAVAPVVPVVPVAPVELRYEYQPTDEHGRPLGGKQVIKYTTPDELASKLVEQNTQLVRRLREVTRKQRLGITDNEEVTAEAEFISVPEFNPRDLSPEERFQLSQDINDPAKSVDAINTLIEASVGMSAAKLRETTANNTFTLQQLTAKSNYDTFEKSAADFYPCAENKQTLIDWMVKTGLQPSIANFQKAQSTLSKAGLLVDRPIVQEVVPVAPVAPAQVPNSQAPAVPESRIALAEQPQIKRQVKVSSGLNEANSSTTNSAAIAAPMISVTLADIEKMPADQYKRWLRDPANKAVIEEINRQGARR